MPDHWGYVASAYLAAGVLLGAYWRHLARRAQQLASPRARRRPAATAPGSSPDPGRAAALDTRPEERRGVRPRPEAGCRGSRS